jgi:hypothetical protein
MNAKKRGDRMKKSTYVALFCMVVGALATALGETRTERYVGIMLAMVGALLIVIPAFISLLRAEAKRQNQLELLKTALLTTPDLTAYLTERKWGEAAAALFKERSLFSRSDAVCDPKAFMHYYDLFVSKLRRQEFLKAWHYLDRAEALEAADGGYRVNYLLLAHAFHRMLPEPELRQILADPKAYVAAAYVRILRPAGESLCPRPGMGGFIDG